MERFAHGWLAQRDIHPESTAVRLFCLPHAGSGAAAFYRWKRALPHVDVCPVLLPGREMRLGEPSLEDDAELVDQLLEAVAPYLDVPFAIFGHSMGALLAYEWALRLQDAGLRQPLCLFVSGRDAAHLPSGHRELHRLDDAQFVAELKRRYGGSSAVLEDAELREVFLPILRSDIRLVEGYRHGAEELLECPVMAFAGRDDTSVSDTGLTSWGELTRGEFAERRFEGDHFYYAGVGQEALLRAIEELLMRASKI
jgi:surfactin synthase thioesterase subunit